MFRKLGTLLAGVAFAFALSFAAPPAISGVILQDQAIAQWQIQALEPLGQSFTAEDPNVLIAFSFSDINLSNPNLPITVNLLLGDGLGGALVGSVAQLLAPGLGVPGIVGDFVDFDFSAFNLVVGQSYTALIEVQNSRWFANSHRDDLYAGGQSYVNGMPSGDLRFRVTPVSVSSLPEPATLTLLGLGLAGLGLAARRRRRA